MRPRKDAYVPHETSRQDAPVTRSIDPGLAEQYLQEYAAACARDNGVLWGLSLLGPTILVDPDSRDAAANQADKEGRLAQHGALFIGRIPADVGVANTATRWAGVRWTMILWPSLSGEPAERVRLMAHESFHRIQDEIGLSPLPCSNDHLDTLEGRLWLQLEWRALEQALRTSGQGRYYAIEDALTFREHRRSRFPGAASEERALEMHEGLAEYTGVKLSGASIWATANRLHRRPAELSTFTRSFAYLSGPAYGLLLDATGVAWRTDLRPQYDLGVLLEQYYGINLPTDLDAAAEHRAEMYGGVALREAEAQREQERQAQIARYRARLVNGPVLILPLSENGMGGYDPNEVVPLNGQGTVHPSLWFSDRWGILTVTHGGGLLNWAACVPAPADPCARPLKGDGWTIELREGWVAEPSERQGDYVLRQEGLPR
jgi:hypothetical protein